MITAIRPASFFTGRSVRYRIRSRLTRARDSSIALASLSISAPLGWKSGSISDGADRCQVGPQLDERRDEHVELGPHRFGGVGRDLDTLWRDAEQQAAEVAAAGELLAQESAGGGARRVQAGGFRGSCLGHEYGKR